MYSTPKKFYIFKCFPDYLTLSHYVCNTEVEEKRIYGESLGLSKSCMYIETFKTTDTSFQMAHHTTGASPVHGQGPEKH